MSTFSICRYCMWSWKEKMDEYGLTSPTMVCNKCLFRASQTQESIIETRRQIAKLFPRSCGGGDGDVKRDVKLFGDRNDTTSEGSLTAHPLVLAVASPVFERMITRTRNHKLEFKHASVHLLRAVVKYLYTGEMIYTAEVTHRDILEFAQEYQISGLESKCVEDLVVQLSNKNLCRVLELSQRFHLDDLKIAALDFFGKHSTRLTGSVLEDLFKLAYEYELTELKEACEKELCAKITRRTNLESLLEVSTAGKGVVLLISVTVFHFLKRYAFHGRGRTESKSDADVLYSAMDFAHKHLGFRVLSETHMQSLRGAFEIGLKERISEKKLYLMLNLPYQTRAEVFIAGAVLFVKAYFGFLRMTGLAEDILKFAEQYRIQDLKHACEIEMCKKVTEEALAEIL